METRNIKKCHKFQRIALYFVSRLMMIKSPSEGNVIIDLDLSDNAMVKD